MLRQQVLLIAFDRVRLGSLGAVSDAIALADRYRDRVYGGHSFYPSPVEVTGLRLRVLTPTGEPVHAAGGLRLLPDGRIGGEAIAKAVVLPAFEPQPDGDRPSAAVLAWLVRQHAGGALVAAAGAGVLVLAEAGILAGQEAVAEPGAARLIAARHPEVRLLPGLPMVARGNVITAATAAGERELARELVRRINSPNTLAWLDAEQGSDEVADALVAQFLHLAREHYAEPLPLAAMATRLGTTERTLRRRCQSVLGQAPSTVVRTLRLDAARVMLGRTSIPVERVGALVGYTDPAAFRAQFRRRFGQAPSSVRRAG